MTVQNTNTVAQPITTLMIRNIPRHYSGQHVNRELRRVLAPGDFDFVYVPWDKVSTSNMGFGFVNFRCPSVANSALSTLSGRAWRFTNHRGEMQVQPARVQGLVVNLERFKKDVADRGGLVMAHAPVVLENGTPMNLYEAFAKYCPEARVPGDSVGGACAATQPPASPCLPPRRKDVGHMSTLNEGFAGLRPEGGVFGGAAQSARATPLPPSHHTPIPAPPGLEDVGHVSTLNEGFAGLRPEGGVFGGAAQRARATPLPPSHHAPIPAPPGLEDVPIYSHENFAAPRRANGSQAPTVAGAPPMPASFQAKVLQGVDFFEADDIFEADDDVEAWKGGSSLSSFSEVISVDSLSPTNVDLSPHSAASARYAWVEPAMMCSLGQAPARAAPGGRMSAASTAASPLPSHICAAESQMLAFELLRAMQCQFLG